MNVNIYNYIYKVVNVAMVAIVLLIFLTLFSPVVADDLYRKNERYPIVILPPSLLWGVENELIVTILRNNSFVSEHTAFNVGVNQEDGKVIYWNRIKDKLTGIPVSVRFFLPNEGAQRLYKVSIDADNHKLLRMDISAVPNIRHIYIQTDKQFYRGGETVRVRALPLTENGEMFLKPLDFTLMNVENFAMMTKRVQAVDRFLSLDYLLPNHPRTGDWKIVAHPHGFKHTRISFSAVFTVADYALPNFYVEFISDGDDFPVDNHVRLTVHAQFSFGAPVDGMLSISCLDSSTRGSQKMLQIGQNKGSHINTWVSITASEVRKILDRSCRLHRGT